MDNRRNSRDALEEENVWKKVGQEKRVDQNGQWRASRSGMIISWMILSDVGGMDDDGESRKVSELV